MIFWSSKFIYKSQKKKTHTNSYEPRPELPPMFADTSVSTWIEKAQLPYWPLYSQQVLHQRWIWGICCVQARKHASEGSTLALNPWQTSPEVQNRSISSPTIGTNILQLFFKKYINNSNYSSYDAEMYPQGFSLFLMLLNLSMQSSWCVKHFL